MSLKVKITACIKLINPYLAGAQTVCNTVCPVRVTQRALTHSLRCGRHSNSSAVPVLQEGALNAGPFIFRGSILQAEVTLWSINLLEKYTCVYSESDNLILSPKRITKLLLGNGTAVSYRGAPWAAFPELWQYQPPTILQQNW